MDLNSLKSFAIDSRKELLKSVSFKIDYVLSEDSHARRENPKAIIELENKIKSTSKEEVIEEVAYTWFNRFIALRYMDMNDFNDVQIISAIEGKTRPEILSNAICGVFDNSLLSENTQNIISSLIDGRSAINDPEKEAYKLILVSVCNKFHSMMPFLFERIADYTELLMPDDLLSKSSIITKMRGVMTIDNCKDVEVIGWLYQFYISDKKEDIFAGLKKNIKIKSKNIPAATQLFTPHWIVKYLVENSLGRLWMLNNPDSNLIQKMEFYIHREETEKDFLIITSPEELKICDPACGSGHMLTYAFDLLYLIYEEEGYEKNSIASLILKNNLYGIEIDKRAGVLSAFALYMKARTKNRNFFDTQIQPNICILEKIKFYSEELNTYKKKLDGNIFTNSFEITLKQFEECDNFGSLIKPFGEDLEEIRNKLISQDFSNDLFLYSTNRKVLKIIDQVEYLKQKYHVVVANPPYMGGKGMNINLSNFVKKNYKDSQYNLFATFMVRARQLSLKNGLVAMINMQSWMFISCYAKLRNNFLTNTTLLSMLHIGERGFDTIGGSVVSTTAFVFKNSTQTEYAGTFIRLVEGSSELDKTKILISTLKGKNQKTKFKMSANEFKLIAGQPILYWVSDEFKNIFKNNPSLGDKFIAKQGLATGDNNKFARLWFEVSFSKIFFNSNSCIDMRSRKEKWVPYNKGGKFRKWYGNMEWIVNWEKDGSEIRQFTDKNGKLRSRPQNTNFYFQGGVTWSDVTSGNLSARFLERGSIHDVSGHSSFPNKGKELLLLLSFLNSKFAQIVAKMLNPTLHFQIGDFFNVPYPENYFNIAAFDNSQKCIDISKSDWDSFETSWDFYSSPFINSENNSNNLESIYKSLKENWNQDIKTTRNIEKENNQVFINEYKLQNELNSDVPINEITLKCNPSYRYSKEISAKYQGEKLCVDTIKEFISYSVGCMFGRYSLEEPGLILANQGENLEDYLKKVPNPSFKPDDDNIIPILNLDWFEDDITARFKKFLRITFSDENFEDNLRFIETSIGKDIRKYFLTEFYKDHIQTYKKRPIYWMFSSPKGSFNSLIYLHRYQKDTVSILLEKYLREFLLKLRAEKNNLERFETNNDYSTGEKNKAIKEIQKIDNIISELQNWIKEVIFPLASQRLEIELDDGVIFNYQKFGSALKKVSGLN